MQKGKGEGASPRKRPENDADTDTSAYMQNVCRTFLRPFFHVKKVQFFDTLGRSRYLYVL